MYAIIETGGKQYQVEKDDVIDVELLKTNDNQIEFKQVLFLNDKGQTLIGAPHLTEITVKGELISEVKGPKVIAFKFKRRKNYRRKVGHRQKYSRVKITDIVKS
ncbi:MAG: 50S ribosomal protein L21 [Simkaniaceae bacterium]